MSISPPSPLPSPAAPPSPPVRPVRRIEIFAWAMYDWANSAYSTFQITILMLYLQEVVLRGPAGKIAYGYGIGISTLFAGVLSPILGAVADAHASKRFWLSFVTAAGALAVIAMYFLPFEHSWIFVGLFFTTSLAYELAWGLYNGFLPEIADSKTMNRISAYGFATGYVGGGLALLIGILVIQFGGAIGLPSDLEGDCVIAHDVRFEAALPPGDYTVTVTAGDLRAAHGAMALSLDGKPADTLQTTAGEVISRDYTTTVTGDRLRVELTGAGADGTAALAGVRVARAGIPLALVFDCGTPSSPLLKGAYRVDETDEFKSYDRAALKGRSRGLPAQELPEEMSFGLVRAAGEQVASRDAVMIPRLKCGLLIMGLWWSLFSLPTLLILRDRVTPRAGHESVGVTAWRAVREVGRTLAGVRRYRTLFLFLVAFLIYNDGVATIISQATVFAKEVLNIGAGDLVSVVLMIQFVSMPGALGMGWLAGRFGEKRTLMLCIIIYIGWLIAAFFISTVVEFWIMGAVLALVMGGIQSVSRSIMGLMTPASRSGEFFGFFNLSSKATSFAGPMLFGSIIALGRPHLAILSLLVFFIVGGGLASYVDVAEGHRRALEDA